MSDAVPDQIYFEDIEVGGRRASSSRSRTASAAGCRA